MSFSWFFNLCAIELILFCRLLFVFGCKSTQEDEFDMKTIGGLLVIRLSLTCELLFFGEIIIGWISFYFLELEISLALAYLPTKLLIDLLSKFWDRSSIWLEYEYPKVLLTDPRLSMGWEIGFLVTLWVVPSYLIDTKLRSKEDETRLVDLFRVELFLDTFLLIIG